MEFLIGTPCKRDYKEIKESIYCTHLNMDFKNKNILITGGLGFLGSNLAIRLVSEGANVTIIDNLNPAYGGNKYNIEEVKNNVKIIIGDIRDEQLMSEMILGMNIVFLFAAQVSYIDSLAIPFEDLELNAKSTLTILELCRRLNPNVKIVFSSSRMVLGKILMVNYDEEAPTNQLSLYGIHKLASEKYLLMYYKDFGIKSTIFRITNPYGPRQQIKHSNYSLPGWFIRCAMEGQTIKIFGEGNQIRDYVFGKDIVESMLLCIMNAESNGEIINMGSGCMSSFKEMVYNVVETVGKGDVIHIPWPDNYERVETGDSIPDLSKLKRFSGYIPITNLKEGIRKTFEYYKKEWKNYVR